MGLTATITLFYCNFLKKKTQFVDCKMVVAVARAFTDYLDQILQSFFAKIVFFFFQNEKYAHIIFTFEIITHNNNKS